MWEKYSCIFLILFSVSISACNKKNTGSDPIINADSVRVENNSGTSEPSSILSGNADENDDSILLLFNPPINKVYKIYNESKFTVSEEHAGQRTEASSAVKGNFILTIKDKTSDGNTVVQLIQTNAASTVESEGEKAVYISGLAADNPEDEFMRKLMDCMINAPVNLIMDRSSQIVKSTGLENIKSKMQKILGDTIPLEAIQIGDPSETIQNAFVQFPDKKLKIGDSWTKELHTNVQGAPIILKNKYTLSGRKADILLISIFSTVEFDKTNVPKEILEQMGELKITGSIKGIIQVDALSGWPVSSETTQTINTVETFEGQTAQTSMSGTVTIKVTMQ